MKVNKLDKLPRARLNLLRQIGEFAQENNYLAFVVGGVVRDLYLSRKNLDLDIVIEGDGIDFARKLSKKFNAEITKHERFNTAVLILPNGMKIDIAMARKEVYEYPGALPKVSPGRIIDDLHRRDFSINAMAIDITPGGFGTLIDFFDGLKDLKDKKIKVLHDSSFIDDPTRILRAIRFEQRFKFNLDQQTFDLMKKAIKQRAFDSVKPPRIWQELYLILNENKPKKYILRLNKICGLHFVHPRLRVEKYSLGLFDSIDKFLTLSKESYLRSNDIEAWLMYFMALTEKLKLSEIKSLAEKFNLTKQEKKKLYSYKNINKSLFVFLEKQNLRPSQIYIVLKPLSYEALLLLKMKLKTKIAKKRINDFLKFYNKIRLSINGHDLNALGVKLDETFKNILDRVFYAKLDGEIRSKQEEINYAEELVRNL